MSSWVYCSFVEGSELKNFYDFCKLVFKPILALSDSSLIHCPNVLLAFSMFAGFLSLISQLSSLWLYSENKHTGCFCHDFISHCFICNLNETSSSVKNQPMLPELVDTCWRWVWIVLARGYGLTGQMICSFPVACPVMGVAMSVIHNPISVCL